MGRVGKTARLDWRHRIEWGRKGLHACSALAALWVLETDEPWRSSVLALAAIGMILVDMTRLVMRTWADWFYRTFPYIFRRDEKRALSGASVLTTGVALSSFLFPERAAATGILCVAWGDAAAAVVGQAVRYRRDRTPPAARTAEEAYVVYRRHGKTRPGTGACFLVSAIAAGLVNGWNPVLIASTGVAAAAMERWTPGHWDNLSIPLVSATVVTLCTNIT